MRIHKPVSRATARLSEDRSLQIAIRRSKLEIGNGWTMCSNEWEEIPVVQPEAEMFDDPISLWLSLDELGNKYGAVKIKPPDGWKPPFCLNFSTLEFTARKQKLHRLLSRRAFIFPKKKWTVEEFYNYNSIFKRDYQWVTRTNENILNNSEAKIKNLQCTIDDYEKEYWYLVNSQASPVEVFYGADLDSSTVGSGFPNQNTSEASSPCVSKPSLSYYAKHPWNLLNLPKVHGSMLRLFDRVIPGVTSPWLYIGMLFSSFCWHTEDDYLASVNYQHCGEPKVWYIIPPDKASAMQTFLKQYFRGLRTKSDILHSLTIQISPELLKRNDIPVYRSVQRENEFILLWPRAFHCGFNSGFNCNEACNIAPPQWLPWGYKAFLSYRFLRPPCISFEELIALACSHCLMIRNYAEIKTLANEFTRLLLDEFRMRASLPETLIQLPFSIPPTSTFSTPNSTVEIFEKATEAYPSVKNPVDCITCTDEDFCKQYEAVCKLPILEKCSSCLTSCYSVICCCIHTTKFLCIRCAVESSGPYPCNKTYCGSCILFYRFSLSSQLRMLSLLKQTVLKLEPQTTSPISHSNDFPCLEKCVKFEELRAGKYCLNNFGCFFLSSATRNNDECSSFSKDHNLTVLYINLVARHLTRALNHENSYSTESEESYDEETAEKHDFCHDGTFFGAASNRKRKKETK